MIKRILFATDFSRISDRAEAYVTQIAGTSSAHVLVLHAIEPISGAEDEDEPETAAYMKKLRDKAEARSETLLGRLRDKGIDCEVQIKIAKRWQAVTDLAHSEDVDLIVLGSHRVREDGKIYLGTTSHKVFFATEKPLLVVPQG